jgi:hypothetical protein
MPWFIYHKKLNANAMALFPFIILRHKQQLTDQVLINHEKIHLRQQVELLIVPFYILYSINYLINLLKYKNHYEAYFNISFEKEAYKHEKDLNYLSQRKWYNWINFYSA